MQNFKDKKILITGGTSGLGRALAREFIGHGASVAVVARSEAGLRNLRNELPTVETIQGDISAKDQLHRIHAEALAKIGDIDVLINNASSLGPVPLRLLIDTDCEDMSQALETNLLGPFRLTKLVLPSMILKNDGLIINISSDAAVQNYPGWGAYSVSKSGLDHLTRIFQAELQATNVHFLALDPGDMDTPLHLAALPDADRSTLHLPSDSARQIIRYLQNGDFTPEHRGLR